MAIPILSSILGGLIDKAGSVASELITDKDKRAQLKADLERLKIEEASKAEQRLHEEIMGQIEINKVEAAHSSVFVAGWRPFVGWVSGAGLAYGVIVEPLFSWAARVWFGYAGNFPEIDPTLLIFALGGMLGIGGMRTIEKIKGVSTDTLADAPEASRNVPSVKTETTLTTVVKPARVLPESAPWSQ